MYTVGVIIVHIALLKYGKQHLRHAAILQYILTGSRTRRGYLKCLCTCNISIRKIHCYVAIPTVALSTSLTHSKIQQISSFFTLQSDDKMKNLYDLIRLINNSIATSWERKKAFKILHNCIYSMIIIAKWIALQVDETCVW